MAVSRRSRDCSKQLAGDSHRRAIQVQNQRGAVFLVLSLMNQRRKDLENGVSGFRVEVRLQQRLFQMYQIGPPGGGLVGAIGKAAEGVVNHLQKSVPSPEIGGKGEVRQTDRRQFRLHSGRRKSV
jgi:hypothetical protein